MTDLMASSLPRSGYQGVYYSEWQKSMHRIPELYRAEGRHTVLSCTPTECERSFPSEKGYTAVFSNKGRLRKFNPTPVNYEEASWRPFTKCLVEGCGRPTKNRWGLCSGNHHERWAEIKTRRGRRTEVEWGWVDMDRLDHVVDWKGVLREDASGREISAPEHSGIARVLLDWMQGSDSRADFLDKFVRDVLRNHVVGKVRDSTTMQLEFEAGKDPAGELVRELAEVVQKHFSKTDDYVDWQREQEGLFEKVPLKSVAAIMALAFASEEANRNDLWFMKNVLGLGEEDSAYASAYMSSVYFYVRRAGATHKQALMSQRTM